MVKCKKCQINICCSLDKKTPLWFNSSPFLYLCINIIYLLVYEIEIFTNFLHTLCGNSADGMFESTGRVAFR